MASNLQILRDQLDALEMKEKLLLDRKRCNEEAQQTLDDQYRRESQRLVEEADRILAELDAVRYVDTVSEHYRLKTNVAPLTFAFQVTTDRADLFTSLQPTLSPMSPSRSAPSMLASPTPLSTGFGSARTPDQNNRGRYGDPYVKPASMSAEIWTAKSRQDKQRLSHVSRIDDTASGMVSPRSCTACADSGRSSSCRVYTPEAYVRYCRRGTGGSCSTCLARCRRCSLVPAKGVTGTTQLAETDDDEPVPKRQRVEGK